MAILPQSFAIKLRDDDSFEYFHIKIFYDEIDRIRGAKDIEIRPNDMKLALQKSYIFNRYPNELKNISDQNWRKNELLNTRRDLLKTASYPLHDRLNSIITDDRHARWLVLFGERLGAYLALTGVSTSQIRNAYCLVKNLDFTLSTRSQQESIDPPLYRRMVLLKPRLAYAAKREGGGLNQLSEILGNAIQNSVKTVGDFSRFSQFFEAILAYHKAYGGK